MGIKVSITMVFYLTNGCLMLRLNLESTTLSFHPLTSELNGIFCLYREMMMLKLLNQLTMKA